jgi:hypothetical protein
MKRSLLSRLSGAVVALALGTSALVAVGAATPASADNSTCTTKTTLNVYQTTVEYGGYESLRGETTIAGCSGGTAASYIGSGAGHIYLERSLDGRTWQAVKTGTYEDYVSWYDEGIVPASAYYRARYTGGKESTSYNPDSFSGSYSPAVRINVIRALSLKDKSTHSHSVARFKLTPTTGLAGKKVTFQVKKGKKWKRYKKVKVPRSGVWKTTFKNSHKGIKYRMIVPAAGGLSGHTYGPFTAYRR